MNAETTLNLILNLAQYHQKCANAPEPGARPTTPGQLARRLGSAWARALTLPEPALLPAEKIAAVFGPDNESGFGGAPLPPPLPLGQFRALVYDPHTVGLDPFDRHLIAATAAVASQLPGNAEEGTASPSQMAMLAAGLGGSSLTGQLIGLGLGSITAMPLHAQRQAQQSGLVGSLVKSFIGSLYGGPD